MNIGGLFGALTPVFFVLALGYLAGKRNAFDADQSAGLSKLALTFALPASLFVSMTDIRKDLLLQQSRLVLALILSHAGLFVVAWLWQSILRCPRQSSYLEMDAATKHQHVATSPSKPSAIVTGLNAGLKSPLLWRQSLESLLSLRAFTCQLW